MANFGDVVDGTFVLSSEQQAIRKYGLSEIKASGIPTVYHGGDVVNLPYSSGEISSIEAIGLAWAAFSSGVAPET
jgi:hypothetical protein